MEEEFKVVRKKKNDDLNKLLIKAEEDPTAQFHLGAKYYNGDGVEQNYEEAVKWFTKSAESGNSQAQYNLAVMYEDGDGVKQNIDEAIKWYKESAKKGNNDSIKALKELGINYKKDAKEIENANKVIDDKNNNKEIENQISIPKCPKCKLKDIKILSEEDERFKKYKIEDMAKALSIATIVWIVLIIYANINKNFFIVKLTLGPIIISFFLFHGWLVDHFIKIGQYYKTGYLLYCKDCQYIFQDKDFKKGLIYEHKDDKKCLTYFLKSANNGNYEAQHHLGTLFSHGNSTIGIKEDIEKAEYWLKKSEKYINERKEEEKKLKEEKESKLKEEQILEKIETEGWFLFNQGNNYYNGTNGKEQDYNKAIEFYAKSADQGYTKAQYILANIYEKGEIVKQNLEKAINYYIKIAQQDDYEYTNEALKSLKRLNCEKKIKLINPEILFHLGIHESNENNKEEAFYWFTKSAELDYTLAQSQLGSCYKNGEGCEKNFEKAVKWLKKSAENENSQAQYNLGAMYENGEGCEQDIQKAFYWYKKSAEQGYECAEFKLGCMYYNGIGTEKDEKQAKYWFTKSAEKGKEEATYYFNIGEMYQFGYANLKEDIEQAKHWYKKSAELGNEYAIQILKELEIKGKR